MIFKLSLQVSFDNLIRFLWQKVEEDGQPDDQLVAREHIERAQQQRNKSLATLVLHLARLLEIARDLDIAQSRILGILLLYLESPSPCSVIQKQPTQLLYINGCT